MKLAKHVEMLLSCAGVQTMTGRAQLRWESGSIATPMGPLACFKPARRMRDSTKCWSRAKRGVRLHECLERTEESVGPGRLTTHELLRCQLAARGVAQAYNW